MNLTTQYLGFTLKNPLVAGASPLAANLDSARRLEDAGIAALTLHSLFEEQIHLESRAHMSQVEAYENSFGEALNFLPGREDFDLTPYQYLEYLSALKDAVRIPVFASLNGVTLGGWTEYASQLESAGADAIELNYYDIPADPHISADEIELRALEIITEIRKTITIPLSIKLSPFFTSLPHFARRLTECGAGAIVLFNRFYQPDINIEDLEVQSTLHLSDSHELNLRLRWLAILSACVRTQFAVTGGVHTTSDVIKSLMAGANIVQLVSALLKNGPLHVAKLLTELADWMTLHEYDSIEQIRGSMSLRASPDPSAYERANYMRILQSWKV